MAEETAEKQEEEIGKVTHFFTNLSVAIIEITNGELNISDTIHIKGATSDFTQKIESMQIEKESIEKAKKGQVIGIKVQEHAREGDIVYKASE